MNCKLCRNRPRKTFGTVEIFDTRQEAQIEADRRNPEPSHLWDAAGRMYKEAFL